MTQRGSSDANASTCMNAVPTDSVDFVSEEPGRYQHALAGVE